MRTRNKFVLRVAVIVFLSLAGLATPVLGQNQLAEVPQGDLINDLADSHPASAYVDASTVLVAEIDWKKINLEATLQWISRISGDRPSDTAMFRQIFDRLNQAKADKILVVAGLESLTDGSPLIIVPTPNAPALQNELKVIVGDAAMIAPNGSAVLIGSPNQLGKYQNFTPQRRNDLVLPLRNAKRLDHTIVVAIPAGTRDLLVKLWPTNTPTESTDSFSLNQLIAGVQRWVFSFRTPPDSVFQTQIETADVASAQRIRDSIEQWTRHGESELPGVQIKQTDRSVVVDVDQSGIEQLVSYAEQSRRSNDRSEIVTTMKRLGTAFYSYESREKHFPPRCFVDPAGKPLHSWLVAVLPDFDQLSFYKSIRLDRAWNDPENERMIQTVPAGVGSHSLPVGHTVLRAPVFPGSLWHGDGPPKRLRDITDGTANTILLIEAPSASSVHWADPSPWIISAENPIQDIFGDRDDARVLIADGSVLLLKRSELDNAKLKAMLTIAAGD